MERLRAFHCSIFTGGVVAADGICSAALPRLGKGFISDGKVSDKTVKSADALAPPRGAVAQRLRGFESAEPEKTVKRSSRRTGVNLQFFPVGAYFFGIVKGEQPLARCGVGGVQRQGGGSRNTPPCLWPSGASLPACTKQKLSPRSVHFSGSLLVSKENISRQAEAFRSTKKRAAAECSSPVKVCALIRSRMQCGGRAARHGCSGCP